MMNLAGIVAGWWQLHNELAHTQQSDSGYPAWWLKSPDVKYTVPIPGAMAAGGAHAAGAGVTAGATAGANLIEQLHAARERVEQLERKVAELERAQSVE